MKLTKKTIGGSGSRLLTHCEWISNGHWLALRENIDNQALFSNVETVRAFDKTILFGDLTDKMLTQVIGSAPSEAEEFINTSWEYTKNKTKYTVFASMDGTLAFIDSDYVKAFDLHALYGNEPLNIFRTEDGDLYVMPCRIKKEDSAHWLITREV